MPVMDGLELLRRMSASEILSSIPVIVVSTEGRSEKINEILSLGAKGFITKPFKPEVFYQKIGENIFSKKVKNTDS